MSVNHLPCKSEDVSFHLQNPCKVEYSRTHLYSQDSCYEMGWEAETDSGAMPPPTPEAHMLARFSKQYQEKYYVKQDRMRGLTYELHTP